MTSSPTYLPPEREDRRALLVASATILTAFGVGAAVQTSYVLSVGPAGASSAGPRLAANLLGVAAMLGALAALRVHADRPRWLMLGRAALAALLGAATRSLTQRWIGLYDADTPVRTMVVELLSGFGVALVAGGIGVAFMISRHQLRAQVHASAQARVQIELALAALQNEEVRVRREVAEGLHGSLQQRLVLLVARIDSILGHIREGTTTDADVEALRGIRSQLEEVREGDVRETSRMLYPDGLEVGMVPAMRSLLGRIPAAIGTRLEVAPEVRRLDDPVAPLLTQTERLLAVRVVEEALTNALRHGAARALHVQVTLEGRVLVVRVHDDGSGFDAADAGPPSGTARLRDRLVLVGGDLRVTSAPGQGTQVEARVPVQGDPVPAR